MINEDLDSPKIHVYFEDENGVQQELKSMKLMYALEGLFTSIPFNVIFEVGKGFRIEKLQRR